MALFDFLNPAKQTAKSGSRWAITNFLKTKQIDPSLSDTEAVNNLFAARYMRVSLEPDQEVRLEHYDSIELTNVLELIMATLDVELEVNPVHNPEGFVDAAGIVQRELSKAGIEISGFLYGFKDKWNRYIHPLR